MIERENTPMTTSSDVIAGLELALASADAMIERLQGERAILRDSAKDVIAWCDANPPAGDALYCITRLRHAIAATESPNVEVSRGETTPDRRATDQRASKSNISEYVEMLIGKPDPRDEVIEKCRVALENIESTSSSTRIRRVAHEALAAIKALEMGK